MKDYKEIAQDVLRRGAKELERNKKRQRAFLRRGCTVAAFGLAAAVGIGVWYGKKPRQSAAGQYAAVNPAGVTWGKDGGGKGAGDKTSQGNIGLDGMVTGMDGGQGGFTDMDGDPSGYGPVPGGNTSGDSPVFDGETDGGFDPENVIGNSGEDFWPEQEQNQPGEQDAADMNGKFPDGAVGDEVTATQPMEMISSYPEDAIYCYEAPKNGEVFFSVPLSHAMEEYGDAVLYKVVVDLFRDGEQVSPESGEAKLALERVIELGYTVVRESYEEGEEVRHHYMLHATKEQLTEFDAGEEYGYMIRFFGES